MVSKLPLDSPLWGQLSACCSAANAITCLREIVATRQLGEAWSGLRDEMLHQGSVCGVSSAAIPHLVDVAPHLAAASRLELWIEIGFMVTAGADRFDSPPAPGLQEGLTAALRVAETLAVRDFLADAELTPDDSGYFALACVALAGHPVGRAMWQFPSAGSGCVRVVCPGCGAESWVDGFADPQEPPCSAPVFAAAPGAAAAAWQDAAGAIERSGRDQVLGPAWEGFFETARQVACAGVPAWASSSAVWCLVAVMVATRPGRTAPWARTLARLAGHARCLNCGQVWAIADAMIDGTTAEPTQVADESPASSVQGVLFAMGEDDRPGDRRSRGVSPATIADAVAGFPPAPGRRLRNVPAAARTLWRADCCAASALTPVAGRPDIIAAGSGDAVRLLDVTSGTLAGPPLPGSAVAVASLTLPDGEAVIAAAGEDGCLRWWDARTGQPLDGAATASGAPVMSLAPVLMPASPDPRTVDWLARLCDGRTVLAVGDADGVVRLWDPVTRAPLRELFRRSGLRVVSMTAAGFPDSPPRRGPDLVAVYDAPVVDTWSPAGVRGLHSTLASMRKLAVAGHHRISAVGVSPGRLGHRKPVLLADRNGTVSMWETFGVRLADPLPPDPAHRDIIGIAVLPAAGDSIVVATASQADRNLRIWDPLHATVALIPLSIQPRCLLRTGDALVIGHDNGVLALNLTGDPSEDL